MALLSWDITTTSIVVLGLAAAYLVGTAIYNTKIHPLRSYPGPTICAITRIPFWWVFIRGDQATWIQKLHAAYGPVVRYGPSDLSYIDRAAWKDIYGHKKGGWENPKDLKYLPPPPNGAESIVLAAGHETHARLRRAFSPAFTEKALRQQEPLFQRYAGLLAARLGAAAAATRGSGDGDGGGRPLDLTRLFNFVTFDTMADLTFGEPLGLLETGAYTDWIAAVFASLNILPVVYLLYYYPVLRLPLQWCEPAALRARRLANFRYSADRVDRRLARGAADRADVWGLVALGGEGEDEDEDEDAGEAKVATTKSEGGPRPAAAMSLAEMHANSEVLMIAGTETTSTWLAGLVYLLLRNPDKLARLRAEVQAAAAAANDNDDNDDACEFAFDALASLPYLNACLDESMRIYPPAPLAQVRIVARREGVEVAGRWVPPGTSVSVHHLAAYRSAANFKNPERFAPERWLGDPAYANDQRDVFKPFSYGPRNCLGQRMAYHEARLLAATVVHRFDLELCDPARDWMDQKIYVLWEKPPLMCNVRRRGDAAAPPPWQGQTETV